MRSNLPRRDSQGPRQAVAGGVELARAVKNPKESLLRGVVGFPRRKETAGEAAQEWPEPREERIEGGAVPAGQGRQLLVDRGSPGRNQPRPLGLTSSNRSGRRS